MEATQPNWRMNPGFSSDMEMCVVDDYIPGAHEHMKGNNDDYLGSYAPRWAINQALVEQEGSKIRLPEHMCTIIATEIDSAHLRDEAAFWKSFIPIFDINNTVTLPALPEDCDDSDFSEVATSLFTGGGNVHAIKMAGILEKEVIEGNSRLVVHLNVSRQGKGSSAYTKVAAVISTPAILNGELYLLATKRILHSRQDLEDAKAFTLKWREGIISQNSAT